MAVIENPRSKIHGVTISPLRQILDERGKVMHMLRRDAPHFREFGEIYFSTVEPGAIKAWHLHKEMVLNYAVPVGKIKFVLYDGRDDSPTRGQIEELFLGPENYVLVTVPPFVWNGFKGVGNVASLVANCASIPYRADEVERLDPSTDRIPYDWSLRNG
jgi:dTDP-4-dehydrorhamnose 3,5-epimerase